MKVRLNQDQKIRIENAKDVAMIMQRILFRQNKLHRKKEYFWSLGLNIANDIEYIELLAIGSLNKVHIDSVEVLSFAVSKKCKKIILCHNHPSGTFILQVIFNLASLFTIEFLVNYGFNRFTNGAFRY